MGEIRDAIQNVVDEIHSSTEARGTALRELSRGTKQLLKDIHHTNQAQAKDLRKRLPSEEKTRRQATREFIEEVGVGVSEICSGTHNFLERFHLKRGDMAKDLRKRLSSEEKARLEAAREFIEEVHQTNNECREAVRRMLDEIASDLRQADEVWGRKAQKKVIPGAAAKKVVQKIEKKPRGEKEKILGIITRHPEGIKLVDIGNELGVDWRSLIGPVKSLVDEDKVEKIESMYYSKRRYK